MTVEEQRYFEECRKVLDKDQLETVSMAMDYGLAMEDIRKVVKSNKNALCRREIFHAFMEEIETAALDFLCAEDFNQYQIREIVKGFCDGLSFEQVKSYAAVEIPANRMKKTRCQLSESLKKNDRGKEEEGFQEYMKGLMGIMESSLQQFKESNERFDVLSAMVKEHVVDEKDREIKDLYENLRYKDKNIKELQGKLAEKEKQIEKLEAEVKKGNPLSIPVQKTEKTAPIIPETDAAGQPPKFRKRMFAWMLRGGNLPQDMVTKIMDSNLSAEQLEEVRKCVESGLDDVEIMRVLENNPTPERMKKMREILLLIRQRKGKAGV